MKHDEIKNDQLEETPEFDPVIDSLCNFLRSNCPEKVLLNFNRYQEMMFAKAALDDLLQKNGTSDTASISIYPEFCAASLWVELDDLEVCDKTAFYLAMKPADNFEVTPLVCGKLRLAFMFNRMFVPAQ